MLYNIGIFKTWVIFVWKEYQEKLKNLTKHKWRLVRVTVVWWLVGWVVFWCDFFFGWLVRFGFVCLFGFGFILALR